MTGQLSMTQPVYRFYLTTPLIFSECWSYFIYRLVTTCPLNNEPYKHERMQTSTKYMPSHEAGHLNLQYKQFQAPSRAFLGIQTAKCPFQSSQCQFKCPWKQVQTLLL